MTRLVVLLLIALQGATCLNIFGIGLVDQGSNQEIDYAKQLGGDRAWILLVFSGITNSSTGPDPSWVQSMNYAYSQNLSVAIRVGPPWGQRTYRDQSDDVQHMSYKTLGAAFARVINALPRPAQPYHLWIEIDNEVNLCYEWYCSASGSPLSYTEMAAEYAHMYRDVATAIRGLNDPQLKVAFSPLAPGGALNCGCCGSPSCPGDSPGTTGLQFMQAAQQSVPDIWNYVDFLASHSYPAAKIGSNFFVPYDQAGPGLLYYQQELKQIGRNIPVLITETGWGTNTGSGPTCTEQQKADWTVSAYQNIWLKDNNVWGVMPFMLMDPSFEQLGFEWVMMSGQLTPVFNEVKTLRCQNGHGPC